MSIELCKDYRYALECNTGCGRYMMMECPCFSNETFNETYKDGIKTLQLQLKEARELLKHVERLLNFIGCGESIKKQIQDYLNRTGG